MPGVHPCGWCFCCAAFAPQSFRSPEAQAALDDSHSLLYGLAGCRSRPRPYGKLRITMCASAQIATGPGLSASPCVNTAPDCSAVCDQEPGNIEGTCSASTPIGQYLRWAMLLQSLSICRSEFKVCKLRISPDVALACRSFPVAKCPEANNMLLYK